jgi:hypothetical protein
MGTVIGNVLSKKGVQAFGMYMPRINWTPWREGVQINATKNIAQDPLTLIATESANNGPAPWVALLAGTCREINPSSQDVNLHFPKPLIRPNGQAEGSQGVLVTLTPNAYTRLARLYQILLETPPGTVYAAAVTAPSRGIPVRPVPRYFFYGVNDPNTMEDNRTDPDIASLNGNVNPGDSLGRYHFLRIYDWDGMPIDPVAVFSALDLIMHYHPSLIYVSEEMATPPGQTLVGMWPSVITGASGTQNQVWVRFCDIQGTPVTSLANADFSIAGLAQAPAVNGQVGLYQANVNYQTNTNNPITLTPLSSNNIVFGAHTSGIMGVTFNVPFLANFANPPAGSNVGGTPALWRDFFTLKVINLDQFLLGTPDPNFTKVNNQRLEARPVVRTNQGLTLLPTGSDVVASIAAALGFNGTLPVPAPPVQTQLVASAIQNTFAVPIAIPARWPLNGLVNGPGPAAIPPNLMPGPNNPNAPLGFQAQWINANQDQPFDVQLTISGLPANLTNAAIRVFTRRFDPDNAREFRGDGAGGVIPGQTQMTLLLRDPLGLKRPDITLSTPPSATLKFDMIIVASPAAPTIPPFPTGGPLVVRRFAHIDVPLNINNQVIAPPLPVLNPFRDANLSLASAGASIMGLEPQQTPANVGDLLMQIVTGIDPNPTPGTPREAYRHPTMANRALIFSDRSTAVIIGGLLGPEALSAESRIGSPGSSGGREVMSAGALISTPHLAWDLAVHAQRRTRFIGAGTMIELNGGIWNPPTTPSTGTFAGAVLENLPPKIDEPTLSLLEDDLADYLTQKPNGNIPSLDAQITWINNTLQSKTLSFFGTDVPVANPFAQALDSARDSLNGQINGGNAPDNRARIAAEVERRMVTSVFGRHDSEWALSHAIDQARHFIYLETPGFGSTHLIYDLNTNNPVTIDGTHDLVSKLALKLLNTPSLRLILCLPQLTDYPTRFYNHIQYELKDRQYRLERDFPLRQVVVFHPVGYPGRPASLATTVMVVDDAWALVGSSTFRRRGLRYDGSTDLVFTDTVYENGICPSIARFRQLLMANRLGIAPTDGTFPNGGGPVPNPGFTRLYDGRTAFGLVQEMLAQGGTGTIEPFHRVLGSVSPVDPYPCSALDTACYNPDGDELLAAPQVWTQLLLEMGLTGNP